MYSCDDSNDLLHAFLTVTCPSAYCMLYRNMSICCNALGAIYRCGKIQYRHSSILDHLVLPQTLLGVGSSCKAPVLWSPTPTATCGSQTGVGEWSECGWWNYKHGFLTADLWINAT